MRKVCFGFGIDMWGYAGVSLPPTNKEGTLALCFFVVISSE